MGEKAMIDHESTKEEAENRRKSYDWPAREGGWEGKKQSGREGGRMGWEMVVLGKGKRVRRGNGSAEKEKTFLEAV